MGRGSKKLVRVVFCGNKTSCPECSFMGNRLQIKLHLKITHRMENTKFAMNPNSGAICCMCGIEFPTRKEVQKHIMKVH